MRVFHTIILSSMPLRYHVDSLPRLMTAPDGDTGESPSDLPAQVGASQGDGLDRVIQSRPRPGIDGANCTASFIPEIIVRSFTALSTHH
ncbi:MAG: hypothetical protein Nkreftii_001660 [Candidatus Nitrospira kreftii]|uniref:Uncharacterized protein n=1 Tax=Candidatus Nitrospira kreftii TaxID=2652173 RepID=A0A7S8IZ58_9BACT|nr:MAG: hypothetical protein Nkreftii_001660 [Candidatus Nitrospira kreftii]